MKTLFRWMSEWATTLRVAPPFSRRRRELLTAMREVER